MSMRRHILVGGLLALAVVGGVVQGQTERFELEGNMKLFDGGNGIIFPDGSRLTTGGGSTASVVSGVSNTAVGVGALASNLGSNNVAVGVDALKSNTNGLNNTAVGHHALDDNTTGDFNTAVGREALDDNTSGSGNTTIGSRALVRSTGNDNVAVGRRPLGSNTSGSNNIALEMNAGEKLSTGDFNITIGHTGVASDASTTRLGTSNVQTRAFIAGISGTTTGVANAVSVLVDSSGQLGTVSSSRRYKMDIRDMADASQGLMGLRPVTFRYTQAYADGATPIQYGLIAEEVAGVYPDLVAYDADGLADTVQNRKVNAMLLNEVQQQNQKLEDQRAQIDALLLRLVAVERRLATN